MASPLVVRVFHQQVLSDERAQIILDTAREIAPQPLSFIFGQITQELVDNIGRSYFTYGLQKAPSAVVLGKAAGAVAIATHNYAHPKDIARCFEALAHLKAIPREEALEIRDRILWDDDRLPYSNHERGGASVGLLTVYGLGGSITFRRGRTKPHKNLYPLCARVTLPAA